MQELTVLKILKYTFLYFICYVCVLSIQTSFAITQTDLVIARYKESLDFLEYPIFQKFRKIYLYNKGPEITEPFILNNDLIEIKNLPNVGCEGHTYLYHMINHREDLGDMTFFIPASWEEHAQKKTTTLALIRSLSQGVFGSSGYKNLYPIGIKFANFSLSEYQHTNTKNIHNTIQLAPCKERPFGVWYEKNLSDRKSYISTYHGVLTVPKSLILANETCFYEKLMSYLENDRIPEAGHYIERSWAAIFNQEGRPLNRQSIPKVILDEIEKKELTGLGP